MFLSIDFTIPDLKEFNKSSIVEEGGSLVISLDCWPMSTKISSQFAMEIKDVYFMWLLLYVLRDDIYIYLRLTGSTVQETLSSGR